MVRFPEKFPECEQILAPDGTYDDKAVEELGLSDETLRSMYESMILLC